MDVVSQPAVPTLTDGSVTLRGFRVGDTSAVVAYAQEPEVQRWTSVPRPYVRRDAESFMAANAEAWRRGGDRGFAIEWDGRWAGTLDLRPDTARVAEVGFGLAAWARGHGVMSRALRLALGWGFTELDLDVVQWRAQAGNWASRRVAWSVGFEIDGRLTAAMEHRGRRVDSWYGVVRRESDFRPVHAWLDAATIRGRAVVLRAMREADVPGMVEACRDPETQHWLGGIPRDYTEGDARSQIDVTRAEAAAGRGVAWTMADPDDDRVLGQLALHLRDAAGFETEMGYWVHPGARGRGVAGEAARLAVRHALLPAEDGGLGLHRLYLRASAGNAASRRVAERTGFREIGRERLSHRLGDGSLADDIRYDLLAGDVPAVR